MLKTPFGPVSIILDGSPLEYKSQQLYTGKSYPDLSGRYGIVIELNPDEKEHVLLCQIDGLVADCVEFYSGSEIKAASFCSETGKITLGAAKGIEYLRKRSFWWNGQFNFDAEMNHEGIRYRIEHLTKPTLIYFGISWTCECNEKAFSQTVDGADPRGWNFKCPCCGYFTFGERPNGTYDICPVCFWEDDPIQLDNPSYRGGANNVSLIEGRENFAAFGSCEKEMIPNVRKPEEDELIGIDWENI
ncbi:MAG: CPCC family cysteine-rich protein [Allobaculum sp.]|uniref:CPCC family cysteine-rich protein n=1 Tax=Allobaculum sp. TaxID=1872463 RepID=UPI00399C41A5